MIDSVLTCEMIKNGTIESRIVFFENFGLRQLREHREYISDRWSTVGLLEGLQGNVRENVAMLFESQLSWSFDETNTPFLNEEFNNYETQLHEYIK